MSPELIFLEGYNTLCVSITELQINYKISFKEAVWQLKAKKKKRNYDAKEEICFLDLQTSSVSEKSPLPKHHPQPSAKLPKTLWSLHPFSL